LLLNINVFDVECYFHADRNAHVRCTEEQDERDFNSLKFNTFGSEILLKSLFYSSLYVVIEFFKK